MKHRSIPLALVLMSVLFSCDPGTVYSRFSSTGDGMWDWQDPRTFLVEIPDTTSMHNIYLQVRHTVEYPFQNLYMFVRVEGPAGQQLTDTVNMVIAAPDGTWKGKGVGRLKELRLLYRKGTIFADPGTYTFTVEQGMRTQTLPITDVGLRIERINP